MKEWAMARYSRLISGAVFCTLVSMCAQAESGGSGNHLARVLPVRIVIQPFKVTDANLQLDFQIRNDSDDQIWVCADVDRVIKWDYEQFLIEETQTLVLRRRQSVPLAGDLPYSMAIAPYVRLYPGESRSETIALALPTDDRVILSGTTGRHTLGSLQNAKRIMLEIGYQVGDLPQRLKAVFAEAEKYTGSITYDNLSVLEEYFPGVLLSSDLGGGLYLDGADVEGKGEINIPYNFQDLKSEKVVHASINGTDIPHQIGGRPVEDDSNPIATTEQINIVLRRFEITEEVIDVEYQIRNNANEEVWICAAIDAADDPSREIESDIRFLQDTQTLQIRKRHDVPSDDWWYAPPKARYVRLNPGQVRIESLSLKLPVELCSIFQVGPGITEVSAPATRLEMEIGYHVGKFPELIRDVLIEGEKYVGEITYDNIAIIREYFPGAWLNGSLGDSAWFLSGINSDYRDTGEFYVQYTFQYIKGEQVLRFSVDGVDIPYKPEHRQEQR